MSDKALRYAEQIAYSSKLVLMFTFEVAQRQSKYAGTCFVECGCAAGAQIIAMLCAQNTNRVYAFDSFKGIMLPSNKDDQMPGIRMLSEWEQKALPDPGKQELKSSGATVVPFKDFTEHIVKAFFHLGHDGVMKKCGQMLPVEGWFEETMPEMASQIEPISLLRLDGDLYNSTYVCLKHLFPKVISDGCVIIDDIQLPGCKAACDDYFQSIKFEPQYQYVDNVAYFIKP